MRIGYLMQAGVPDIRGRSSSGPANHVLQVCRELVNLGHQVRLIAHLEGRIWKTDDLLNYHPVTIPSLDQGPFRLAERVVRRTQSELRIPYLAFFDNLRFAAACCKELKGYDLLYERMGWMGGGGSRAASRLGVPHVLELNGDHLLEHEMLGIAPSGLQRRLSISLMSNVIRKAAHTVATGEGWRRRHLENWKVDPSRVSVIQNGSAVVDLLPRDELRCFGSSAGPGRPLELIYVGAFDPWQNLPLLLRAVSSALASGSDIRLTMAGAGVLREELEKLSTDLHLERHITFTGHLPMSELLGCLRKADVGVSPYTGRQEFTGLKQLDYKGAGLATIATGIPGQPSLIEHGHTGVIVPPDDEDALVAAIRDLERSPETVAQLGRQARLEAEQRHRWRHTAEALERLFLALLRAESPQLAAPASQAPCGGGLR
jgi:glycosyltransferase involved in cell wall biosynthesis